MLKGWSVYESPTWTRKGAGRQKNTSIDIVMTMQIPREKINVSFAVYDKIISDHVGVIIEIEDKAFQASTKREREHYVDKSWLQKIARDFLAEFIEAKDMNEMRAAFQKRLDKGIKT